MMSSSSILKANNPPLQWEQSFLQASWPTFSCRTLRISVCFAKPATEKLSSSYQVFANSSSSPKKLVLDDSNNVVAVPCIKKPSFAGPPRWFVIKAGQTTTTDEETSSGKKKIVAKTVYGYEESLKDTTTRYQAMAAMTLVGSLVMFMVYGHLPALAASRTLADRSKFKSLRPSSSSRFCDSDDDEYEDHDCDYCPMEASNPSAATQDQARNNLLEMTCYCNRPVVIRTSWTTTNPWRRFRACTLFPRKGACSFFEWVDRPIPLYSQGLENSLMRTLNEVENGTVEQDIMLGLLFVGIAVVVVGVKDKDRESDAGVSKGTKGDV